MNSRERILNAFARKPCDRIPFGELVIDSRCATAILGRDTPVHNVPMWLDRMSEGDWQGLVEQDAADRIDLAIETGLDWISVDQNSTRPGTLPVKKGANEWLVGGVRISYDPNTMIVSYPDSRPVDTAAYAEALLAAPRQHGFDMDDTTFAVIGRVKSRLEELGRHLPLVMRNYVMGVQYYLELIACHPEAARIHFEKQAAWAVACGRKAVEHGVTIFGVGGHLGANGTSMISDAHFRALLLPSIREQVGAYHKLKAMAYVASGGCIWPLADSLLLDSGADAYAGIDTYAGMDLSLVKEKYGDRICLISGIDSVELLCRSDAAQVREQVFRVLESFKKHAGFIFSSSNSIHNGVPPENFFAMVNAYKEFYGL